MQNLTEATFYMTHKTIDTNFHCILIETKQVDSISNHGEKTEMTVQIHSKKCLHGLQNWTEAIFYIHCIMIKSRMHVNIVQYS